MRRGRTKQCQVPIRTRRRQSDAKWRASVASCYETLKFIIPNSKSVPKRKASKSLILQETEKHIGTLERAISRLLNIEAQEQNQGVLWKSEESWHPATLADFQNDFSRQQRGIFHQSPQGRRCYNMLHDIQEEILGLSVDCSSMAFLPLSPTHTPAAASHCADNPTRDAATCTTRRHRVSKARCRMEAERASQRILSAYKNGERVNAVIPYPSLSSPGAQCESAQAVPASLATPITISGTPLPLVKMGNCYVATKQQHQALLGDSEAYFPGLSALDQLVVKQASQAGSQQNDSQEVPVMTTPCSDIGVTTQQDLTISDMYSRSQSSRGPSFPGSHSRLGRSRHRGIHSKACKKLDFGVPPHSLMLEEAALRAGAADTLASLSSGASVDATGFTPLKAHNCSATATATATATQPSEENCATLTPVKKLGPYMSDTALASPNSAWTLGGGLDARFPETCASDLEGLGTIAEDQNLLCMENIDLAEDDGFYTDTQDRTPQGLADDMKEKQSCKKKPASKKRCRKSKKHCKKRNTSASPSPKCRKRLEGLYAAASACKLKTDKDPVITGIFHHNSKLSDFDGYLLYYQQVAPGLRQKLGVQHDADSLAGLVSEMWRQLSSDDRHTMVTLAALENQDSNSSSSASLSQDLSDLNVTPLDGKELGY